MLPDLEGAGRIGLDECLDVIPIGVALAGRLVIANAFDVVQVHADSAVLEVTQPAVHLAEAHTPEHLGVADIVLYAYTHTCEEGGYRLADYPAVAAWLRRVETQPGHIPLEA